MATTETKPENKPETKTEDKQSKVSAADVKKVMEDPRFDLPASRIRTAEDAYQAYLREEIDESELRAVVAANGGSPFAALRNNLERPDNAFQRDVPEDLYADPSIEVSSLDDRLKVIKERDEEAEKAAKESEKEDKDVQNVRVVNS
jgi:hypothetical protein